MRRQKVLCVSFDIAVSDIHRAALNKAGYAVTSTTDVKETLNFLSREKFDLVIVGHRFATADKYVLTVEAEEKANTAFCWCVVFPRTKIFPLPAVSMLWKVLRGFSPQRQHCYQEECGGQRHSQAEICAIVRKRSGSSTVLLYFPMQNVLKIRLRMSSVVVAPVISSSGRRAL